MTPSPSRHRSTTVVSSASVGTMIFGSGMGIALARIRWYSAMVRSAVLAAESPGWRRWDWEARRPAEWHPVDPDAPIVIEGCGALSRANRELATFAVWIELDREERYRRAMERDGDVFAPHWDRWAVQEHAFYVRERPDLLADVILDNRTGTVIDPRALG